MINLISRALRSMSAYIFSVVAITLLVISPVLSGDEAFSAFPRRELATHATFRSDLEFVQVHEREGHDDPIDVEADPSPANVYATEDGDFRSVNRLRMRAEFEPQSSLLIAGGALWRTAPSVLSEIARATSGHVPVVMLVNDDAEGHEVRQALAANDPRGMHLIPIPHDTVWTRDYGPAIVMHGSQSVVVDAAYTDVDRSRDDNVPNALATLSRAPKHSTSLCMPGGNLLTNGRGICITTTRVQVENAGMTQAEIAGMIGESYGASVVAILEPLHGEDTGHVDMFATFTDEHTVVVGKYDRVADRENAAILDRNAARLASIPMGGSHLRVVRIPMPSKRDGHFPTYTNVVYANGRLLVPIYESTTPHQMNSLNNIYADLLPGWEVRFIRVDELIRCGGALHCVVSNLGTLSPIHRDELRESNFEQAGWFPRR